MRVVCLYLFGLESPYTGRPLCAAWGHCPPRITFCLFRLLQIFGQRAGRPNASGLTDDGKYLAQLRRPVNRGVHAAIAAILHDEGNFMHGEEPGSLACAAFILRLEAKSLDVAILRKPAQFKLAADEHVVARALAEDERGALLARLGDDLCRADDAHLRGGDFHHGLEVMVAEDNGKGGEYQSHQSNMAVMESCPFWRRIMAITVQMPCKMHSMTTA